VTGNGNVPKYDFWLQSNTSQVYSVFFKQFFEATGSGSSLKKNGQSNIALPSLTWEWTPVVDHGDGNVEFNMTALNGGHGNNKQFTTLTFANHLKANATIVDNKTAYTPLLKFDVIIQDYTWVTTDDKDAKVVLLFSLTGNGNSKEKVSGNKVTVDGAFLDCSDTASSFTNPDETTSVSVSLIVNDESDASGIWLVYDHWTGAWLIHDPAMGIDGPSVNVGLIVGLSIAGVILIVAIIAGFVLFKRRRSYQAL